jgi:hypothetical protein
MGTSEGWSADERTDAARQMRGYLEQQSNAAASLGLSSAQFEALEMIREHGHRQAYKAAKHLAQIGGRVLNSEDAGTHFEDVLAAVSEYRSQLPGWRRLLGV